MRSTRLTYPLILLCAASVGCAGWKPIEPAAHPQLQRRDVLKFDFVGETVRLHAVQFIGDSVFGVPWLKHLTCDSCRVSYPLSRVRDARVGRPEENVWLLLLPVSLAVGYAVIYAVGGAQ